MYCLWMSNYFTMYYYKIVGVAVLAFTYCSAYHCYCYYLSDYKLGVHVYCLWPLPHLLLVCTTLVLFVCTTLVLLVCTTLVLFVCTTLVLFMRTTLVLFVCTTLVLFVCPTIVLVCIVLYSHTWESQKAFVYNFFVFGSFHI